MFAPSLYVEPVGFGKPLFPSQYNPNLYSDCITPGPARNACPFSWVTQIVT